MIGFPTTGQAANHRLYSKQDEGSWKIFHAETDAATWDIEALSQ